MPSKLKQVADALIGWIPEYQALNDAYNELNDKNLKKGDNYYHRLGMCRAVQLKNNMWPSEAIATILGYVKEADDLRGKLHWGSLMSKDAFVNDFLPRAYIDVMDSKKDLENNADGRRLGLQNPNKSCRMLLKDFDIEGNRWKNLEK